MASTCHSDRRLAPLPSTFIHMGKSETRLPRSSSYSGYITFAQSSRKLDAELSCLKPCSDLWPDTDSECGFETSRHGDRPKTWTPSAEEHHFEEVPLQRQEVHVINVSVQMPVSFPVVQFQAIPLAELPVTVVGNSAASMPAFCSAPQFATFSAGLHNQCEQNPAAAAQHSSAATTQDKLQALLQAAKLAADALVGSAASANSEELGQHVQRLQLMLTSMSAAPNGLPESVPPVSFAPAPSQRPAKPAVLDLSSLLPGSTQPATQPVAAVAVQAAAALPRLLGFKGPRPDADAGKMTDKAPFMSTGPGCDKKSVRLDLDRLVSDAAPKRKAETTLMIQNLPVDLTQQQLLAELDNCGFKDLYNFCYMPRSFGSDDSQGFAFVNFASSQAASALTAAWQLKQVFKTSQEVKQLNIMAAKVQGLQENLAKWVGPRMQRVRNLEHWPYIRDQAQQISKIVSSNGRRKLPATSLCPGSEASSMSLLAQGRSGTSPA